MEPYETDIFIGQNWSNISNFMLFRIKGRKGKWGKSSTLGGEDFFTLENIFCLNFKPKLKCYSQVRKSIRLVGRDLENRVPGMSLTNNYMASSNLSSPLYLHFLTWRCWTLSPRQSFFQFRNGMLVPCSRHRMFSWEETLGKGKQQRA